MVGRWRSGAPLVLTPEHDDPTLGTDPNRNNDFSYSDDMEGLNCPFGAHIRRVNPRDALKNDLVAVNLHHFLRRGTSGNDGRIDCCILPKHRPLPIASIPDIS
jgi:deferrochelatase/peroxidase EfeB